MTFEIPHALKQAILDNKLIIFTGAGISRKEGLPSWNEMVLKILNERKEQIDKAEAYAGALISGIMSPLEILDKIEENSKKHVFDIFEDTLTCEIESQFLCKLNNISTKYITTNFDSLLEQNTSCKKITKDNYHKLSKIDNEDSYVLKIHGDIETIDSCVIFSTQYNDLYIGDELATFQLRKLFSQYTVLFIGFSFTDPFVTELFDQMTNLLKGLGPDHYIITTEKLNHAQLNDILIKEHSDLDTYVDSLVSLKKKTLENNTSLDSSMGETKSSYPITVSKNQKKKIIQIDGSDLAPSITNFVGREKEIGTLNNDFKVFFITGIGGQGKSALAAHFLELKRTSQEFQMLDWRDFKEEDHKFQGKIISMIMLVRKEDDTQQQYTGLDDKQLIDTFFDSLGDQPAIFVLDNVDSYIDLEEFEPLKGIGELFKQAILRSHKSKFIFTCRPFLRYADVDFYQLSLGGLDKDTVLTYFNNATLPISNKNVCMYATRSFELTRGHPLWISIILAQAKRGENELEKLLNGIGVPPLKRRILSSFFHKPLCFILSRNLILNT